MCDSKLVLTEASNKDENGAKVLKGIKCTDCKDNDALPNKVLCAPCDKMIEQRNEAFKKTQTKTQA